MIGRRVFHALSGERGVIDAEVIDPSGKLLVRLNDHWFFASDTTEESA